MTFTTRTDPFLTAELAYHRERLLHDVALARTASRRRRGLARVLAARRLPAAGTGGGDTTPEL